MPKEPPALPHGVRLRIAYDGTDFHGWQAQPGFRTVQGELERAIKSLGIETSRVRGASRTDRGVHAQGQVAAFACNKKIPERGWIVGLGGVLPNDISVTEARPCHRLYNPRYDADKKLYRYLVKVGNVRDPISARYAWQYDARLARRDASESDWENGPFRRRDEVSAFLNLAKMREAAQQLVGEHDFQAFRAYDDGREHTQRTMERVDLVPGYRDDPRLLAIEIVGDGFMKNMVRIFVGTLTDVGRGRLEPPVVGAMLHGGTRGMGGPTAPAHGLTLEHIWLKQGDHKRAFR